MSVVLPVSFYSKARERLHAHRARIYAEYQWATYEKDKLQHFTACFAISLGVHLLCLLLSYLPFRCRGRPFKGRFETAARFVVALTAGALAGLAKEAGDLVGLWPWCPPCDADVADLAADGVGIGAAAVVIALGWCSWALLRGVMACCQGYSIVTEPVVNVDEGEIAPAAVEQAV